MRDVINLHALDPALYKGQSFEDLKTEFDETNRLAAMSRARVAACRQKGESDSIEIQQVLSDVDRYRKHAHNLKRVLSDPKNANFYKRNKEMIVFVFAAFAILSEVITSPLLVANIWAMVTKRKVPHEPFVTEGVNLHQNPHHISNPLLSSSTPPLQLQNGMLYSNTAPQSAY